MVDAITPTYYAGTDVTKSYDLTGLHFDGIPNDAVGIYANNNEKPLEFINSDLGYHLFTILEKTNTSMRLLSNYQVAHNAQNYLGAIVSANRQTIYWVNDTKPLP